MLLILIINLLIISHQKSYMEIQSKSFIQIPANSDFSFVNIPFGIYSKNNSTGQKRPATRLGNFLIDLYQLQLRSLLNGPLFTGLREKKVFIFDSDTLNKFMSLTRQYWLEVRETIQTLFSSNSTLKSDQQLLNQILHEASQVTMHLPAKIGDYSDFYSSRSHAFNVGSIIRGPANALQENWFHIPIGYHGRASSIVISGTDVRRPRGQIKSGDKPVFSECKRLDFEIQMGYFVGGKTNPLGHPLKVNHAWDNIFGFVILNDWSFRDFQTWQYVPLGPFTAKNGATTISPWVVTVDALRGAQVKLSAQDPEPLAYLKQQNHKSFDIKIELDMKSDKMQKSQNIIKTNMKHLYWSCAQQLTHHSVSGCNMQPGDLLGTGTISGDQKNSFGSLLQITWGGKNSFKVGEEDRIFLQDGDSVIIRAWSEIGNERIGFGECSGKILPALGLQNYY